MTVNIISFGYLHGDPPADATITLDLRNHFRDPHVDPALRELDATHKEVRDAVMGTPGISDLAELIAGAVLAYLSGPTQSPVTVAAGGAGGRHRAPIFAARLAVLLEEQEIEFALTNRDLFKPVVNREPRP